MFLTIIIIITFLTQDVCNGISKKYKKASS